MFEKTVVRIYQAVVISWGFPRAIIAFFAGAAGALSLAPFGFLPALVISMTLAVWLLDGAASRSFRETLWVSAVTGWWFGFGYFVAGLWWLGAAFLVEADRFAWLMPLGIVGLPAVLAFFHAFGFMLARLVWSQGFGRIFAFTMGLCISEWLRGHIFTGFPWNAYGMAFGEQLWLAQSASIFGLYGLTLITIFLCAIPATLVRVGGIHFKHCVFGIVCVAALATFGAWRIPTKPVGHVADVKLRIMQPNLPQDAKFRVENRDEIMKRYLDLSDRATSPQSTGVSDITHLIWPESAFPFILTRDPTALAQIAELLPQGVSLITGAITAREGLPGEVRERYYNSIVVVSDDGTVTTRADKVHLVPFGEYLPFKNVLHTLGLRQFIPLIGGFEAGETRAPLAIMGLPLAAPLICYEAIFSGEVMPHFNAKNEPSTLNQQIGVLLNLTNDAWFGNTPGPYQHFSQARLRAIEEGIPMVRAANSGISGVVDPYGRVVASIALNREGVIDSHLPLRISPTIYSGIGDVIFFALVLIFGVIASLFAWRRWI